MNTLQNYNAPTSDATPACSLGGSILSGQIEHLRNICLLAGQIDPTNYAMHRSIEDLGIEIDGLIHRLEPAILEAISHPSADV